MWKYVFCSLELKHNSCLCPTLFCKKRLVSVTQDLLKYSRDRYFISKCFKVCSACFNLISTIMKLSLKACTLCNWMSSLPSPISFFPPNSRKIQLISVFFLSVSKSWLAFPTVESVTWFWGKCSLFCRNYSWIVKIMQDCYLIECLTFFFFFKGLYSDICIN